MNARAGERANAKSSDKDTETEPAERPRASNNGEADSPRGSERSGAEAAARPNESAEGGGTPRRPARPPRSEERASRSERPSRSEDRPSTN